jgi:hypothetical protein
MLAPGKLVVRPVTVRFLKRFIFTQEGHLEIVRKRLPGILHSRWRAADGRQALVLANYTRDRMVFQYIQASQELSGTLDPRSFLLLGF